MSDFVIYRFNADTGIGEYVEMTAEEKQQLLDDQTKWENIDGV